MNDKETIKKGCETCIFFHKGLRQYFGEQDKSIIGECDNILVQTRICVSYGMICDGKYHVDTSNTIKLTHNQ